MNSKDYNLGLDIGATSVGWAAIDNKYNPIKTKGKTAIGVRLFNEGRTAADRREFRTTRRRLNRRKWRLSLLEEFFDPYITPIDPTFFARLKKSNLSPRDDKKQFKGSLLFPDKTDHNFYNRYPTIYHLRYDLMTKNQKFDIREIYLAIHHIVKYRGNFLNSTPVSHFDTSKIKFKADFMRLNELYQIEDPENLFTINLENEEEISEILLNHDIKRLDKQKQVAKILVKNPSNKSLAKVNKKIASQISKAILGYKVSLNEILKVKTEDVTSWKVDFSDPDLDDKLVNLIGQLDENQQEILNIIVHLSSQLTLNGIVPSGKCLSESMIDKYVAHKAHLKLLKKYLNTIDNKKRKIIAEAYAQYVGNSEKKLGHLSQDKFYKEIKKNLDKSTTAEQIKELIDNGKFMPKQRTNQNGVIPYQLHQKELDRIIENQAKYYPWLAERNPVKEHREAKYKLDELVAFRIPYYVGPLVDPTTIANSEQGNQNASFAWMVRKKEGRITPWNFDEKVDKVASANKFIRQMTTKDTYLIGEDVLPAHSLLYERFKVLNELNMIRLNGHKLDIPVKQRIYKDLFQEGKTVTKKKLVKWLQINQQIPKTPQVTGLSNPTKFNSQLDAYIDLKKILGEELVDNLNYRDDLEKIIEWSTVFEDNKIYKIKLQEIKWLTDEQISALSRHRYQGWGRLSKRLLTELTDKNGKSIIDLMWETQRTFIEIQSRPEFAEQIANANQDQLKEDSFEDILGRAYTSPQNKKAIRQVIKVVDDVVRATGKEPKFISIEFARSDERSQRTHSRLSQVQETYETTAKELVKDENLRKELANVSDLTDRLYLYFTQLGRDMYTGKPINIDEISTMYDIDHILPQSFLKDDSLSNRVLIRREENNAKSDTVPVLQFAKMKPFWISLQKHGLISKRKLNNLMTNPNSIDKFKAAGFVNRQLVETRQVIKLAANILAQRYPHSKIIEVKASLTHQMRESFDLIKNRDVNDYHHAFDGYLSAFVGQYLYDRYPKLQSYFVYGKFKKFDKQSSRISMKTNHFNFLYDLENDKQDKIVNKETGEIVADRNDLIRKLNRVYNFKFMLVSQEVYTSKGALYNQTLYSPKSGKKLIPMKKGKPTKIYGGYSGNKDAYMAIVKIHGKKEDKYQVVGIPIRVVSKLNQAKNKGREEYLAQLRKVIAPKFAKKKTNRKTGEVTVSYQDFDIILPKVMYRQLIVDGDQKFTLGSSTYQYNARQLVLSPESVKAMDPSFIKNTKVSDEVKNNRLVKVYDDILDKVNSYFSLYDKNKFRLRLNKGKEKFAELPLTSSYFKNKKVSVGKTEILQNILIGLHDNASSSILKDLGFSTPFGQLQTKNGISLSKVAYLVYQSPTGLFERKVYLNSISPVK